MMPYPVTKSSKNNAANATLFHKNIENDNIYKRRSLKL